MSLSTTDTSRSLPQRAKDRSSRSCALVALIILVIAFFLLFTHLGHYALWDDEAVAALIAKGVWNTGDTSAEVGNNIVAYRNGLLIKNTAGGLKDRSSPPLQYYIAAPFAGIFNGSALAVRVPMATMGAGCVVLLLYMLLASRADLATVAIFGIALIGNASFFLYFRQCRYYAPTILLAVGTVWSYLRAKTFRGIVANSILWLLLFTAHYLTWAAVAGAVAMDYVIWGRHRRRLSLTEWLMILLPQMVIGGLILWIWNPHSIDAGDARGPWLTDRLTLLWWSVRDLNVCEYGAGLLLILAPLVGVLKKNEWIIRGSVALAIGIVVVVILSPQSTSFPDTTQADVRYFCALIPLCILLETLTLRTVVGRYWLWLGVPAAIVLFWTNVLQGGFLLRSAPALPVRSTLYCFVRELLDPPTDPYTVTAKWINSHVEDAQSILVLPDFARYPFMFHAPKAVYAWQLNEDKVGPGFDRLPPIDFQKRVPPDYIIGMAQAIPPVQDLQLFNIHYQCVAVLDVFGVAAYRPELFWRTFSTPPCNPPINGVKIYQRQ